MNQPYDSGAALFASIVQRSLMFLVLLVPAWSAFGTVGAGERGVKLRFSAVTGTVLDEGLYFLIPFAERVVTMSVQIEKYEASADAASKDLQSVSTTVAVNYHLNPETVDSVYQEFRDEYRMRIIEPSIQEAVNCEWLVDIVAHAQEFRVGLVPIAVIPRHHDDGNWILQVAAKMLKHKKATSLWHHHVQNDQIRCFLFCQCDSLITISCHHDFKTC